MRYAALRVIGTMYQILAALLWVLTLIGTIAAFVLIMATPELLGQVSPDMTLSSGSTALPAAITAIGIFFSGSIMAVGMFGFGELLHLFVELAKNTRETENNTRALAQLMQRQLSMQQYDRSERITPVREVHTEMAS